MLLSKVKKFSAMINYKFGALNLALRLGTQKMRTSKFNMRGKVHSKHFPGWYGYFTDKKFENL